MQLLLQCQQKVVLDQMDHPVQSRHQNVTDAIWRGLHPRSQPHVHLRDEAPLRQLRVLGRQRIRGSHRHLRQARRPT